jgi:DNA-directed RNA polymerase specialized sigma24 family protein
MATAGFSPQSERSERIAAILLSPQVLPQVLRTVQRWIYDREEANDVLAVLVEKVTRTYHDDEVSREKVLLIAREAAKTISLDEIRKQQTQKRGGSAIRVPFSEDFVGTYLQRHAALESDWVEALVKRLPEDLQQVTRLFVFEGEELTAAIRATFGDLDERSLNTLRARWYHHLRKLEPLIEIK